MALVNSVMVDVRFAKDCIARWEAMETNKYSCELEQAELARDIRKISPTGPAGNVQFLAFVKRYLKHARSDVMLAMAQSFDVFQAADWYKYGGWKSIRFLYRLTKVQRRDIMQHLKGPGPYHYAKIVKYARQLGFEVPSNGHGRPSRDVQEAKTRMITSWVLKLYKLRPDLPPMPDEVQAALSKSLAGMASVLGARA